MERYILLPYEESEEFEDVDGCYFMLELNIVVLKSYNILKIETL